MPHNRAYSFRNAALQGRERGVWHPDLVGVVRGYPRTEAAFRARQASGKAAAERNGPPTPGARQGVPDGFAGRRAEVDAARQEAMQRSEAAIAAVAGDHSTETDAGRIAAVFAYLAAVVLAVAADGKPVNCIRDRNAAARVLLTYLLPMPARRSEVALRAAEDSLGFLLGLAGRAVAETAGTAPAA